MFNRINDKTLNHQRISNDSKLRYIYINKKADPQLKCIAIQAIVFLLNVIYTIAAFILFAILEKHLIIEYISFGYFFLSMIIKCSTILIINLKK